MDKRNIGKEIIEGFEALKKWRQGKIKLVTHHVETLTAADLPAPQTKRTANRMTKTRRAKKAAYRERKAPDYRDGGNGETPSPACLVPLS